MNFNREKGSTMDAAVPPPPPEANVIKIARMARGLSPEKAAERTPIRLGGGRWRHIEQGYQRKKPFSPARAPDLTLAHMAHTVGASPEQLAEAGREGAAEILREILRQEAEAEQESVYADLSDRLEAAIWEMDAPLEQRKMAIDALRDDRAKRRKPRAV